MSQDEAVVTRGDYRVRLVHQDDTEGADPRDADNLGVMWTRHRRYTLGDNPGSMHMHIEHNRDVHRRLFPEWWDLEEFVKSISDHPGVTTEAMVKHLVRAHKATVVLPLYLLDHSGLSMSAGHNLVVDPAGAEERGGRFVGDEQGWDTSYVGFIFDTERTRAAAGIVEPDPEGVEKSLRGEVAVYSSYLEGDVWGWIVERKIRVRITRHELTNHLCDEECADPDHPHDGSIVAVPLDERVEEYDDWDEVGACWGFIGYDYAVEAAKEALDGYAPRKEG